MNNPLQRGLDRGSLRGLGGAMAWAGWVLCLWPLLAVLVYSDGVRSTIDQLASRWQEIYDAG